MANEIKKEVELKGKKICIICKKALLPAELKTAKKVKEDEVIRTIRKIKNRLNVASKNELYVCKEHLEEHKKRRKSFEKNMIVTLVIAVVVFLGLSILPVLTTGNINFSSILLGIVLAVLLTLLSGLMKYTPAREV